MEILRPLKIQIIPTQPPEAITCPLWPLIALDAPQRLPGRITLIQLPVSQQVLPTRHRQVVMPLKQLILPTPVPAPEPLHTIGILAMAELLPLLTQVIYILLRAVLV